MLPKYHAVYGFFFSLTLFLIFPSIKIIGMIIIFFSSVFIDIDHYIYYIIRKKDFNFKRAYLWSYDIGIKYEKMPEKMRKEYYIPVYFLHGIEPIILVYLFSFLNRHFSFVFIGFIFHLFLDFVSFVYHDFYFNRFCITYEFIRSKNLKHIEDA